MSRSTTTSLSRVAGTSPARLRADPDSRSIEGPWPRSAPTGTHAAERYRRAYASTLRTARCSTGSIRSSGPRGEGRRRTGSNPRCGHSRRLASRPSSVYEEANAVPTLGTEPHGELCHRLADLREAMGRPDEALAWHRLVLEHEPDDPTSRVAVERLAATTRDEAKVLSGPREPGP